MQWLPWRTARYPAEDVPVVGTAPNLYAQLTEAQTTGKRLRLVLADQDATAQFAPETLLCFTTGHPHAFDAPEGMTLLAQVAATGATATRAVLEQLTPAGRQPRVGDVVALRAPDGLALGERTLTSVSGSGAGPYTTDWQTPLPTGAPPAGAIAEVYASPA